MPTSSHDLPHHDDSLAGLVLRDTGESVARCYQCGKCAAGCPLAVEMDLPPSQVLRLLQLALPGVRRKALRSLRHLAVPDLRDLPRPLPPGGGPARRSWTSCGRSPCGADSVHPQGQGHPGLPPRLPGLGAPHRPPARDRADRRLQAAQPPPACRTCCWRRGSSSGASCTCCPQRDPRTAPMWPASSTGPTQAKEKPMTHRLFPRLLAAGLGPGVRRIAAAGGRGAGPGTARGPRLELLRRHAPPTTWTTSWPWPCRRASWPWPSRRAWTRCWCPAPPATAAWLSARAGTCSPTRRCAAEIAGRIGLPLHGHGAHR